MYYDEACDHVFCHLCAHAEKEGKLRANCKDLTFLSKGYCNWKEATEGTRRHEQQKGHVDAVQLTMVLPKSTHYVGEVLSAICAEEKANN